MIHWSAKILGFCAIAVLSSCVESPRSTVPPIEPPPEEPPNKTDYEKFVACGAANCDGSAQRIEGGTPFAMYNMACIVQALRDRTPGIYGAHLNHTWTNGSANGDYTLVVQASGDVLVGVYRYTDLDQERVDTWAPIRKCALIAPNVLDACLTEVKKGQGPDATEMAWECVFPEGNVSTLELPWFVSCEDTAPTCQ
jgi:hypothetical protein